MGFETSKRDETVSIESRNHGLTKEEETRLHIVETDLFKAEAELCRAKRAYDELSSLRIRRPLRLTKRKNRAQVQISDDQLRSQRIASETALHERKLVLLKAAEERAFFNSFQNDSAAEISTKRLLALFRKIGSLDHFARHVNLTRRNAINALKIAGVDVIEEIAREWEKGSSLRDLSAKHGPLPQTLSKWVKATGRQIRPRNSNQKYELDRMKELFNRKWTTNRIAISMGLSWATVQKASDLHR